MGIASLGIHSKNVFENVDFNLAFSNSKNIKKWIVRTKLKKLTDILLGGFFYAYGGRLKYMFMETN